MLLYTIVYKSIYIVAYPIGYATEVSITMYNSSTTTYCFKR